MFIVNNIKYSGKIRIEGIEINYQNAILTNYHLTGKSFLLVLDFNENRITVIALDCKIISYVYSISLSMSLVICYWFGINTIQGAKSPVGAYKRVEALQFFSCFQTNSYRIIKKWWHVDLVDISSVWQFIWQQLTTILLVYHLSILRYFQFNEVSQGWRCLRIRMPTDQVPCKTIGPFHRKWNFLLKTEFRSGYIQCIFLSYAIIKLSITVKILVWYHWFSYVCIN